MNPNAIRKRFLITAPVSNQNTPDSKRPMSYKDTDPGFGLGDLRRQRWTKKQKVSLQ